MKIIYLKLILLFICLTVYSCELTTPQEEQLNTRLNLYLYARNNCKPLQFVAFTFPNAVRYYKNKGENAFLNAFSCNNNALQYENPIIEKVVQNENIIHILYQVDVFHIGKNRFLKHKKSLVAISENNGKTWFFLDFHKYLNSKIIPITNRLL